MSQLAKRPSQLETVEIVPGVLEGEIVDDTPSVELDLCESGCGHFHSGDIHPDPNRPCGDYRCCIN